MSVAKIKTNDWKGENLIGEMVQLRILRAKNVRIIHVNIHLCCTLIH